MSKKHRGSVDDPPFPPRRGGRDRVEAMDRVLRLIEARITGSVRLAELSACAGVSGRTLHAMFHEAFGVSPMRYVRIRKLQMVHATLILADSNGLTVSGTCARLGLSDCGRVASDYRRLFGEYPSETLARRLRRKGMRASSVT